jgi:putative aldouronate transport system permease protein
MANQTSLMRRIIKYKAFYFMFLPVFLFFGIFHYLPYYGLKMAFYNWGIFGQQEFIGFKDFIALFSDPVFISAFLNTLIISGLNLAVGMVCTIIFALLLNELATGPFKKFMQTITYLPHFLSWVVVAAIFTMILSPDSGIINEVIKHMGGKPIYFLISNHWWVGIFVAISQWKGIGWGTIIYLAALTGVDPQLYEAAAIDGAGRLKQTWHITLPALQTTILTLLILHLAKILDIFQPIFVMYNSQVYKVADVIGTYTFRLAFTTGDIDMATAVGLSKSIIAMMLVLTANYISNRIKGESLL